ncbi:hypothetical protein ACFQV2_32585 [Actinokineospora soli]|uniref:Crp/Fnr family transcriptional regulator n=1 Tax=Actinokineospora soli TaxID=1048753 RepID=A0ABW2TUB3_9PSEU
MTHPPDWGAYRRGLLRDALAAAGFPGPLLLPTVVAAGEAEHAVAPLRPGQSLGVALLGGRHVEFAVLVRGQTAFELADHAAPPEPAAGAALDDLLADLGGRAVKERLSTAVEVAVGDAVVTRAAFADLARPLLTRSLDAFHAYLSAHRPDRATVAGGTARVPLVTTLIDALPAPTTLREDPATAPARGAALAARPRLPAPRASGSHPGMRPVRGPEGSDPALRPAGSNPRMLPVGARAALDELDTVVSHPGFPPVRLPADSEPPPRPPVEITPLEPPPRRFPRARRGRGDA